MNKASLLKATKEVLEGRYTQAEIDDVLTAFCDVVKEEVKTMEKGDKITLNGLGSFSVKDVPRREGVTQLGEHKGEKWVKEAHKEPVFKLAKAFKESLM